MISAAEYERIVDAVAQEMMNVVYMHADKRARSVLEQTGIVAGANVPDPEDSRSVYVNYGFTFNLTFINSIVGRMRRTAEAKSLPTGRAVALGGVPTFDDE